MNTDNSAGAYASRAIHALGQAAHDSERVAIWCYDNPPRKELPKASGARDRHVYISHRTLDVLAAVAGYAHTDKLAESILLLWIKENVPEIWDVFDRHEQELESRLKELHRNEPDLQPHCSSDIGEAE